MPLIHAVTWLIVLVSSMPIASLAANTEKTATVTSLSTVIVNGVPLSEAELNREINRLAPVAEYHNLSKERWQAIRKQAIDNIVDKELFYREGIQRGISWDEQWVEYTFEKNREEYATNEHTRTIFDNEEVKNRLYEDLRRTYVISKLWQEGKKQVMPNEQEVETYFLNNHDKYTSPKTVKVIELLVEMKPTSTEHEWDKAKQKVDSIYKRVKKENNFTAYQKDQTGIEIKEKIIHEGMQGYDIKRIEKLANGEISKPLFTLKGYVLFQKLKSIPQVAFSFTEVQVQVKNDLHNIKYQQWLDSLRLELRDKSKIIIGAGTAYVGR
jgi:hypothetical protein